MFSVFERELLVVLSCFDFVFCHTNVCHTNADVVTVPSYVDSAVGKTAASRGQRFLFISTVACFLPGRLVFIIEDPLIMAFDYHSHVRNAAAADREVVSI